MKILNRKTLWEGRYLRTSLVTYLGRDGMQHTWEAYDRPGINGIVVIVPITDDGKTVLIRQFRPAIEDYVIELPAGLNDQNESPADCAHRELKEETGYRATKMERLVSGPYSAAASGGKLDIFLATGLEFVGKSGGDDNEDIEVIEIPIDEAMDFLLAAEQEGNLIDLKIFGMVELARRRIKKYMPEPKNKKN